MRVLVTGSKGFVGHWLVEHLVGCGDDVISLDAEVDITDAAALTDAVVAAEPEGVVHLAAVSSVGASWAEPEAAYLVNTIGTAHVLDAARACPAPPRVLLISSSEVYGRVGPADLPLSEGLPYAPVSPYAASKAAAELLGLQAWLGHGLEVVRARPFNHTGPGQRPDFVVPALAQQVARAVESGQKQLDVGNLDARRDLTDVRDVVKAYRCLLVDGKAGQVYNVCQGESVTIRQVAERLLALAGVDIPIVVDPARVRQSDIPELRGDPSRIEKATGWRPEIPLDVTLADVLRYWQEHL
ncbi:MAG: GDP-mannose 4,6-dehydratase [Acidimicrobiales bacterium]|nr:GDP-mannose 4,6-dehydratase [Acidimicrobiales bacterium]